MFTDGDVVCFLGDSIVHAHPFHGMILAYYLTRFPDRTVRFVNAGVAGDSAGGALTRLDEDVIPKAPSVVAIMLGMNDIGRGNYVIGADEEQRDAQAHSLQAYRANLTKVLERLRNETSARLILMTPTPYDQTCVNDLDNNFPGCNGALHRCAEIAGELAEQYQAEVVDLHTPMTAFNLSRQEDDPSYTLIGPDCVHPGLPGNFMMAWLFLKAQGAPSLVSDVVFDVAAGRPIDVSNAAVSDIARNDKGWSFSVLEKALPYPIDERLDGMLDQISVEKDLNQEIVRFTGLVEGSHVLSINGVQVGCHTAAEWAAGVNVALNRATPQVTQAEQVAAVNEQRRQAEVRLRGYACTRWFLRHRQVDPDDVPAIRSFVETKMAKTGYYEERVPTYLSEWAQRDDIINQVTALEREALQARVPVPHRYEIRL